MPVELFNMNLLWSVPADEVRSMADIVKGDARVFQNYRLGLTLTYGEFFVRWVKKWVIFKEIGIFFLSAVFLLTTPLFRSLRCVVLEE